MRGKTFFTILTVYLLAALLLPVLPARKSLGAHTRKSLSAALWAASSLKQRPRRAKSNNNNENFPVQDQENIRKTFALPATGPKSLEIDNVWGSIEVIADAQGQVQLAVDRTTRAESKEKTRAS